MPSHLVPKAQKYTGISLEKAVMEAIVNGFQDTPSITSEIFGIDIRSPFFGKTRSRVQSAVQRLEAKGLVEPTGHRRPVLYRVTTNDTVRVATTRACIGPRTTGE